MPVEVVNPPWASISLPWAQVRDRRSGDQRVPDAFGAVVAGQVPEHDVAGGTLEQGAGGRSGRWIVTGTSE
ncbi:hypothetical protein GCM10010448_59280 [Streptomyces glomeratus]|uniref:Uncharacterized protein n=1 Tax=Streptomyces glomeratus TaxID=284452 RepID=A0ABP6LZ17_9ACTN